MAEGLLVATVTQVVLYKVIGRREGCRATASGLERARNVTEQRTENTIHSV